MTTHSHWSEWRPFPDPRKSQLLIAPFGPGCYELRHHAKQVLFGKGNNVAYRMCSLLPAPFGCGKRDNKEKRDYVLKHLAEIEYRTLACQSAGEADASERSLKQNRSSYLFGN